MVVFNGRKLVWGIKETKNEVLKYIYNLVLVKANDMKDELRSLHFTKGIVELTIEGGLPNDSTSLSNGTKSFPSIERKL